MKLIDKRGPSGDRQEQIDATVYEIEVTGAQLRQMARLSYAHEGGDEFPHDPHRVYNWVQTIEPDIDPRARLDKGKYVPRGWDR